MTSTHCYMAALFRLATHAYQVKAIHHIIRCIKALHIHIHIQTAICMQQKWPDCIPCRHVHMLKLQDRCVCST